MEEENKTYWTDDDELVAKYVLGQITPEEKERMDAEIAGYEPGRAKLQAEMEIAAGIRRHGRDLMKMQLRTKLRRSRAAQFNSNHYVGLAAAVLLVAIGLGAYQIWFSDLTAPKKFHEQEIVLTPSEEEKAEEKETTEQSVESVPDAASAVEPEKTQPDQQIAASSPADRNGTEPFTAQNSVPPPIAMAEADEAPAEGISTQTQAIWLIGTVVMINDRPEMPSMAAGQNEGAMKRERALSKEKSAESIAGGPVTVKRRAKDAGIVLQQRAIKDLPAGFAQRKDARRQSVQTLLERSDTGISLTLYGDAVNEEDLREAVVERMTDDSLVVSLPHQRIAFRLPSGWNSQPARR
jgi:hypothetical protein